MKINLLAILGFIPFIVLGQNKIIKGRVLDSKNQGIEFVNIISFKADSTFVNSTLTDSLGNYGLRINTEVLYVKFKAIGYKDLVKAIKINSYEMWNIILENDTKVLEEVIITKPSIERYSDKLIVNVSNSILSTGLCGIEILERSPGLFIENNGAISLRGRSGVNVLINGRQQRMSPNDLTNYLRSIPSSQIERIEIIHNPTAGFDAEGSAGIVNIILKKDGKLGTNGSTNASYGQGIYGRTSEGLSLNRRTSKASYYLGLNHNFDQRYNNLLTTRRFETTYNQNSKSKMPTHSYLANLGATFRVGKRSDFGVDMATNWSKANQDAHGESIILDENNSYTGEFKTQTRSTDNRFNISANTNYLHNFNSNKGNMEFNADYAHFNTEANQKFETNISNNVTQKLLGNIDGDLDLFVLKGDLNSNSETMGNFSFGAKSSFVSNTSKMLYFDEKEGAITPNDTYSNEFKYKENINAAYISWNKTNKKWSYQLGLRMEHTDTEGKGDTKFTRDYVQWFPSLSLQHTFSKNIKTGFNANRRINRPDYGQLNPFRTFVDISTSRAGNPELVPEIAINFEVNYDFNRWLNISLSYSNTKDRVLPVLVQDDANRHTTVQLVNIEDYNYYGINTSINVKPVKGLSSRLDLEFFYNEFLGWVSGFELSEKGYAFRVRSYSDLKLGKGWTSELWFFYQPLYDFGITGFEPRWKVDLGVQKSIFSNQGKIKLVFTDVFWTYYPRGYTRFGNINEEFESIRDTRVATLSFTYNFGNNNVKVNKNKGGAQDEKKRV